MAFVAIQIKDIADCLAELKPPIRKRKNVLKCLTIGLTDCYSNIAVQKSPGEQLSCDRDDFYTKDVKLGSGAFSEVMRSYDMLGNEYAIKKIRSEYLLLAVREIIFLRCLQRKTRHGGDFCKFALLMSHVNSLCFCSTFPVVTLVDAFMEGENVSLVLDMCQSTLLDYMTDSRNELRLSPGGNEISVEVFSDNVVRPM